MGVLTWILEYVPTISSDTINQISTTLVDFGNKLLGAFTDLLPAMAGIAAIFFVIGLIRSKVY